MIVVSDTSPINYLALIGELELLQKLYGVVVMPTAVQRELLAANSPDAVRQWAAKPPEWVRIDSPRNQLPAQVDDALDAGEREAIALAIDIHADLLIIDDAKGREAAARLNLQYTGTLGVLLAAAKKDLIDLHDAIQRLRRTSFFVSEQVLWRVLHDLN